MAHRCAVLLLRSWSVRTWVVSPTDIVAVPIGSGSSTQLTEYCSEPTQGCYSTPETLYRANNYIVVHAREKGPVTLDMSQGGIPGVALDALCLATRYWRGVSGDLVSNSASPQRWLHRLHGPDALTIQIVL